MKKILLAILILPCICILGCWSLPRKVNYNQLYSITKVEKRVKSGFTKKKVVLIKDFRENEMYEEDIAALKEKAEKYILAHPDLSDSAKDNLRELKITIGAGIDEVQLLLGNPDKIIGGASKAGAGTQTWIYRINKSSAFIIVAVPVFFTKEGYYLYFKDNLLTAIERHYLEQVIQTGSPSTPDDKSKD